MWLVNSDDLSSMYCKFSKGGETTLWCDGKSAEIRKQKRTAHAAGLSREEKEEEVNQVFQDLKEKHSDLETSKLRLWVRMISFGLHSDYDSPTDIPPFASTAIPKCKPDSPLGQL